MACQCIAYPSWPQHDGNHTCDTAPVGPCYEGELGELVNFRTSTFIQLRTAFLRLVHQHPKCLKHGGALVSCRRSLRRQTDIAELKYTQRFGIAVLGALVQLEVRGLDYEQSELALMQWRDLPTFNPREVYLLEQSLTHAGPFDHRLQRHSKLFSVPRAFWTQTLDRMHHPL